MTKREIDEAGFEAARAHAEATGWLPDDGSEADREDGYRQLGEILSAYLGALPEHEPARDRIAVVSWLDLNGKVDAFGWVGGIHEMPEETFAPIEAAAGRLMAGRPPFARAIVRCNLPRPAQPIEVDGTVEEP